MSRNYGKKKVAQKERPTQYKGSLFSIHNPYTPELLKTRYWTGDYYQFIAIDPAIENFGFRVERRYVNGNIVGEVLFRAQFTGVDELTKKKVNVDKMTLENIVINECTEFLDDFDEYYDDTHFILIEQQMIENWYSTRIMQHVITYFIMMFRDGHRGQLPIIAEVHSKLKGDQLGYTKRSGLSLKEWAVVRTKELLEVRKDRFSLKMIEDAGTKKDDMSDVVVMIEAFCRYLDIPPFTKDKYIHEHSRKIGYGITDSTENALTAIYLYDIKGNINEVPTPVPVPQKISTYKIDNPKILLKNKIEIIPKDNIDNTLTYLSKQFSNS